MKHYLSTTAAIAAALLGTACQTAPKGQDTNEAQSVSSWANQGIIYEVNIRQYTPEGTFNAFSEHLPRLKQLGVDILWLMPVNPISVEGRKGSLGSYYSVADYKGVNPQFGTEEDLHNLISKAHELGMKVILDWVANHSGCDNIWTKEHADWYVKNDDGSFYSPYDWTDTYELNYDNKEMRLGMIDAMKYWVNEYGIDGFRCDVAYEVPNDFWPEARQALDSIRPLFMLAESEQPALQHTGAFDMCYNWPLKNILFDIAKGNNNAAGIDTMLVGQEKRFPKGNIMMNHLTNHDLNSWDGSEFVRFGDAVEAFAVLTYTIPGMPLLYTGQEVGMDKTIAFFEKDSVGSWEANGWTDFYTKLNDIRHSNAALNSYTAWSEATKYETSSDNVLAFKRSVDGNEVITILNLSAEDIELKWNGESPDITGYTDAFNGTNAEMPSVLKAWSYYVLTK
ncbi:MAG: alpha-amylase family glycosyl hydrolase [Bacteroidales bacterium]|nr:alpha-amylase family glycosyl hydrolase [Bacteroidales bacterium]